MSQSQSFTGTVEELSNKVAINGHKLSAIQLSTLIRVSNGTLARKVGTVPRPASQRGKPVAIYELSGTGSFNVGPVVVNRVPEVPTAPEVVSETAEEAETA